MLKKLWILFFMSGGLLAAPLRVDVYLSLTCGGCAVEFKEIMDLQKKYGERLDVHIHDFPIDKLALKAAQIAQCQRENYLKNVRFLFDHYSEWVVGTYEKGEEALISLAKEMGIPFDEANACLESKPLKKQIMQATKAAQDQGVNGTPTIRIDGKMIEPVELSKVIEGHLEKNLKQKQG